MSRSGLTPSGHWCRESVLAELEHRVEIVARVGAERRQRLGAGDAFDREQAGGDEVGQSATFDVGQNKGSNYPAQSTPRPTARP